jgi:hypothetical protein
MKEVIKEEKDQGFKGQNYLEEEIYLVDILIILILQLIS